MPSYTISDGDWLDTAIDVVAGQVLRFSASGTWAPVDPSFGFPGEFSNVGPGGYPNASQRFSGDSYTNLTDIGSGITNGDLLSKHTNWGAVVGFIAVGGEIPPGGGSYPNGDATIVDQAQRVFLIKEALTYIVPAAGRLYIAQNDDAYSGTSGDNSGSVQVVITSQIDVRCGDIIAAAKPLTIIQGVHPATIALLRLEFYRNNTERLTWIVSPRFADGDATADQLEDIGTLISVDSNNNLYVPLWTFASSGRRVLKFPVANGIMTLDDTAIWWEADALERCLSVSVDQDDNVWVLVSVGDADPFSASGLKLYKLTTSGVVQSSIVLGVPLGQTPGDALSGADIDKEGQYYYASFFATSPYPRVRYEVSSGVDVLFYSSADRVPQGIKVLPNSSEVAETIFSSITGVREYLANLAPSGELLGLTAEGPSQSTSYSDGINLYEPGKIMVSREESTQVGITITTVRKIYSVDLNTGAITLLITTVAGTGSFLAPLVMVCPRFKRQIPQATLIGAT